MPRPKTDSALLGDDARLPPPIRPIDDADLELVLELNRRHEVELSPLSRERLELLLGASSFARIIGDGDAFLIGLDQDSDYPGVNFLWFKERYPRFAYVDRVAVAEASRGRGHARRLYEAFFAAARQQGQQLIGCEVNKNPPNPGSDAFHARLGFRPIGEARHEATAKTVRYFIRSL